MIILKDFYCKIKKYLFLNFIPFCRFALIKNKLTKVHTNRTLFNDFLLNIKIFLFKNVALRLCLKVKKHQLYRNSWSFGLWRRDLRSLDQFRFRKFSFEVVDRDEFLDQHLTRGHRVFGLILIWAKMFIFFIKIIIEIIKVFRIYWLWNHSLTVKNS